MRTSLLSLTLLMLLGCPDEDQFRATTVVDMGTADQNVTQPRRDAAVNPDASVDTIQNLP